MTTPPNRCNLGLYFRTLHCLIKTLILSLSILFSNSAKDPKKVEDDTSLLCWLGLTLSFCVLVEANVRKTGRRNVLLLTADPSVSHHGACHEQWSCQAGLVGNLLMPGFFLVTPICWSLAHAPLILTKAWQRPIPLFHSKTRIGMVPVYIFMASFN